MTRKTLAVTTFLMTALLTLTACGGEDDTSTASHAEFNNADVTFATEMIPHHQQAVEMAELAADRGGRELRRGGSVVPRARG
mgnify:CR=1 FL=1